jgi:hypothetical protein
VPGGRGFSLDEGGDGDRFLKPGNEEREMSEASDGTLIHGIPPYVPSDEEVDRLIERASVHPLGVRFLVEGHLGSVAATFETHAFTVDAARERLAGGGHRDA